MILSPSARKWVRGIVDYGGVVAFFLGFFYFKSTGIPQQQALMQATWVLVPASAVALAIGFVFERRIAPLPLISGLFALVFGGLTLIFHDVRFIKMKPTVTNASFGVALLVSLLVKKNALKLVMGEAIRMPEDGWRKLAINYVIFFFAVAIVNEVVWRTQPDDIWVLFRFPGIQIITLLFTFSQVPLIMKYAKAYEPPPAD
jgi:intracellular septation protein